MRIKTIDFNNGEWEEVCAHCETLGVTSFNPSDTRPVYIKRIGERRGDESLSVLLNKAVRLVEGSGLDSEDKIGQDYAWIADLAGAAAKIANQMSEQMTTRRRRPA